MKHGRFLAFDLGAESGRAMVGTLADGRLSLEEIHRFPNGPVDVSGTLYWDVLALYNNILKGMRGYVERFGESVDGIGINTWGLDFGLLAADGSLLQNPVCYRDRRTEGMATEVAKTLPPDVLYALTGINLLGIETLCQMLAMKRQSSPILSAAKTFLMMPDLLAYFLTGRKCCERTNANSTQFYDTAKGVWSDEILDAFGFPPAMMPELVDPGTILGELSASVKEQTGFRSAAVIAPCTHDTPSAVAAVPGQGEDWAFISSGTWSVVGALSDEVVATPAARAAKLCNEVTLGGFFLCRNIMGLWLLQQSRAAWRREGKDYTYADLGQMASAAPAGGPLVNPDDIRFLAPDDMPAAIRAYCMATGQTPPETVADTSRCILESLAFSYRQALDQIGRITGRRFGTLYVVGGGSQNEFLCQITANVTDTAVVVGPVEATATGNVLTQAYATGHVGSVEQIRRIVHDSTELSKYEPQAPSSWRDRFADYQSVCGLPAE